MSDGVAVREEGKHLGFLPDVALHGCQTRGPGYIPCVLEDKQERQGGGDGMPSARDASTAHKLVPRERDGSPSFLFAPLIAPIACSVTVVERWGGGPKV